MQAQQLQELSRSMERLIEVSPLRAD